MQQHSDWRRSQNPLRESPQLSLLLGIQALEITQHHHEARAPLAEQALRESLVLTGGQGLPIRAGGGSQAEFSSDNHWLVTVGNHRVGFDPEHVNNHETITVYSDNVAYLWDLRKAHPEARSPRVLRSSNLFGSIRISPDSRWLISGMLPSGFGSDEEAKDIRLSDLKAADPPEAPGRSARIRRA